MLALAHRDPRAVQKCCLSHAQVAYGVGRHAIPPGISRFGDDYHENELRRAYKKERPEESPVLDAHWYSPNGHWMLKNFTL